MPAYLHLVVEIKGYRREDAKDKKNAMEACWVPGVNNHGDHGRWAFAEFTDVWEIQSDFEGKVESEFDRMIAAYPGVDSEPGALRLAEAGGSEPCLKDMPRRRSEP